MKMEITVRLDEEQMAAITQILNESVIEAMKKAVAKEAKKWKN